MFVRYVTGRVLWWLCGVGECSFGQQIVVLCLVHKCGLILVVIMRKLRG